MMPGGFMMGAHSRLLPLPVPMRFFAAAMVFHPLAWAMLLAGADAVPGFRGGLGPVLAGLHLVTLGVLAMIAIGAAFQLLPVAIQRPLGPTWACGLAWWLYVPGVALLCAGLATGWVPALHGGAGLSVAGLLLAGLLIARCLIGATGFPGIRHHAWLALASLLGLAVLGLLLAVDFRTGWLPDHTAFAAAHAVLTGYGFMGNLAMGFTYVLVPMFVLGPAIPDAVGKRTGLLAALALALAVCGALAGLGWLAAAGGAVGLGAVGLHFAALRTALAARMRKRLESFFRLLFPAWVLLPVGLAVGIALALGAEPAITAPLWGFLMVFGWLLTFATGILQRVMPFLVSMHTSARGGKPALVSQLTADRPLLLHAVLHGVALLLVALGIIIQSVPMVRAGAAGGLAGALALLAFAVELGCRTRAHLQDNPPFSQGHT